MSRWAFRNGGLACVLSREMELLAFPCTKSRSHHNTSSLFSRNHDCLSFEPMILYQMFLTGQFRKSDDGARLLTCDRGGAEEVIV